MICIRGALIEMICTVTWIIALFTIFQNANRKTSTWFSNFLQGKNGQILDKCRCAAGINSGNLIPIIRDKKWCAPEIRGIWSVFLPSPLIQHGKRGMPFWTCIKIKIKVKIQIEVKIQIQIQIEVKIKIWIKISETYMYPIYRGFHMSSNIYVQKILVDTQRHTVKAFF